MSVIGVVVVVCVRARTWACACVHKCMCASLHVCIFALVSPRHPTSPHPARRLRPRQCSQMDMLANVSTRLTATKLRACFYNCRMLHADEVKNRLKMATLTYVEFLEV